MANFSIQLLVQCFCIAMIFSVLQSAITRDDTEVFSSWINGNGRYKQRIFSDVDLRGAAKKQSITTFKECFLRNPNSLGALNFYFNTLLDGKSIVGNERLLRVHFKNFYSMLQNDVEDFLDYLYKDGISSQAINRIEKKSPYNAVINKYNALMLLLFAQDNRYDEREYLFSVANIFFEYCFSVQTFPLFKTRVLNSRYHPIVRLLYSIIWRQLAGNGWKEWHASCLHNLKQASDKGKTIVYIAGGCDIYQLIKQGIYNIHIIDPMLPTQPAYYAEHWGWLVKRSSKNPGIGDCLRFTFKNKLIVMKRSSYQENGSFTCKTDRGTERSIPQSITKWTVYEDSQPVGAVTFDRRYCEQKDFLPHSSKQLLISFNELYYVMSTDEADSWNINPLKFRSNISLLVKQLRKPLSKSVLRNMVKVDQLPFSFIKLGSCAE